jgi:hypothetical protein
MKWLRFVSYLAVIAVVAGMHPRQLPEFHGAEALAQGGDAGIFGFTEADWEASLGSSGQADGFLVYTLADGGSVYVRFDGNGVTTLVEYTLGEALSPAEMENFVVGELLPGDAQPIEQYPDFFLGDGGQRVNVHLFYSDAVVQFFPGYSGMIVVAYAPEGSRFSLSIGTDG